MENNSSFEEFPERDSTTGSGYSEAEREISDSTNSQNPIDRDKKGNGSQELVERYNINDKAYSDSSKHDFVKTISKFHHADPAYDDKNNIDK